MKKKQTVARAQTGVSCRVREERETLVPPPPSAAIYEYFFLRAGSASGGGRDPINKGKRLMGEKGRMNNEEEENKQS